VVVDDTADTADTADTGPIEGLSGDFVHDLTVQSGCGDYTLLARNDDDSLAIIVRGVGLASAAHAAGAEVEIGGSLNPNSDSVSSLLEVRQGVIVSHEICNDALDPNLEIDVQRSWEAVGGSFDAVATPAGDATEITSPTDVVVGFTNVDVEDPATEGAEPIRLEDFSISAHIGWLPG